MESAGLFGTVCNTARYLWSQQVCLVQCAVQQGIDGVSRFVWYSVQYSKVLMESAGLFGTVCNTARY